MKAEASNTQIIAKKVWSIFRIILVMLKKGISKSKLILDLNLFFKRGNELAGKAINGLIVHHNSLICRHSNPNHHFISPKKEYEFSCSNSPELGPFHLMMAHQKRAKSSKHGGRGGHHDYRLEDPTTVAAVQRVLDMLNAHEGPTASPLGMGMGMGQGHQYSLPGFGYGKSPMARQLRVTDSPFPLKHGKGDKEEEEEDVKVNKAADEFIKKFYRNLMMQKSLESPYHMSAR